MASVPLWLQELEAKATSLLGERRAQSHAHAPTAAISPAEATTADEICEICGAAHLISHISGSLEAEAALALALVRRPPGPGPGPYCKPQAICIRKEGRTGIYDLRRTTTGGGLNAECIPYPRRDPRSQGPGGWVWPQLSSVDQWIRTSGGRRFHGPRRSRGQTPDASNASGVNNPPQRERETGVWCEVCLVLLPVC
jgi:hypothetical protein